MSSNISDHDHPMHKGPHHDKYMHSNNKGGGSQKPHVTKMSKLEGHEKPMDEAGHMGKMSDKGC
jgi:hypothetical protein